MYIIINQKWFLLILYSNYSSAANTQCLRLKALPQQNYITNIRKPNWIVGRNTKISTEKANGKRCFCEWNGWGVVQNKSTEMEVHLIKEQQKLLLFRQLEMEIFLFSFFYFAISSTFYVPVVVVPTTFEHTLDHFHSNGVSWERGWFTLSTRLQSVKKSMKAIHFKTFGNILGTFLGWRKSNENKKVSLNNNQTFFIAIFTQFLSHCKYYFNFQLKNLFNMSIKFRFMECQVYVK